MTIYIFQIFLVIISFETFFSLYYLFFKIKKRKENITFERLKQKWQIRQWKKVYPIILIILITFFISIILVYNESFLRAEKSILGSVFPLLLVCNPITQDSNTVSGLVSHTFTAKIDKGTYKKGETLVITVELNPGITSTERTFLSDQVNVNIYYYDGQFNGNGCAGNIVKTQFESINTNDLTGSGIKKVEYQTVVDLDTGCYCIKSEATNLPSNVDPMYLQGEVIEQTTTTTESTTTTTTRPTTTSISTTTTRATTTTTARSTTTTRPTTTTHLTTTTHPTTTTKPTTTTRLTTTTTTKLTTTTAKPTTTTQKPTTTVSPEETTTTTQEIPESGISLEMDTKTLIAGIFTLIIPIFTIVFSKSI